MQIKRQNKKAFTLIELLIVIAIIGILFIVLVSKVDFATDKAKATGVQTDFRSFQLAFDTVAKENAGFNTFGWDTGDTNGDHVRNSYDTGDTNKDGKKDPTEVWTGRKEYTETWTGVYTLVKPGTNVLDSDAIFKLESAINKNLDPKLHITIGTDGKITMANQAMDPWKTEYHGAYISNAASDGKDRGALIMYSNGANQEWGSEHRIADGTMSIVVPGNNIYGQDDMSIVSCYTYTNGYGEVKNMTTGFSNNQSLLSGGNGATEILPITKTYIMLSGDKTLSDFNEISFRSEAEFNKFIGVKINNQLIDPIHYTAAEGSTIVTFKQSFLRTLDNGVYDIEILSDDGYARAKLTVDCDATVVPVQDSLNDYSWEDIKLIAQSNLSPSELSSIYNINLGDTKINNGNTYYLVDLDGNSYEGFIFMYQTNITARFNHTNTATGGYIATTIAEDVETIYENLNDIDLKNNIKEVTIKCNDNNTNPYALNDYNTHMFLPSLVECGEFNTYYQTVRDGETFDFFENNRTAQRQIIGGPTYYWWTRTVNPQQPAYAVPFGTDGLAYIATGVTSTHVSMVLTFVIG